MPKSSAEYNSCSPGHDAVPSMPNNGLFIGVGRHVSRNPSSRQWACFNNDMLAHRCTHHSLTLLASHTACLFSQPTRCVALQAAVAGCTPSAAPHAAALAAGGPGPPGPAAARGALAARTLFAWRLPASPHLAVQREGTPAALGP